MEALLLAVLGGLLTGVTYALLALGLVLLFRATQVFNFAHGQFALGGAYIAAWMQALPFFGNSGASKWLAVALAVLCVGLIAALLYRTVLQRLTGTAHWFSVFATFGIAAVADSAMAIAFSGRELILVLPGLPSGGMMIGGISLSAIAVVLAAVSLLIFLICAWFVHYTSMGRAMTASGHDPLLASLGGIAVHKGNMLAWGLAGALAAVAGITFGASNVVTPAMVHLGLLAFPAMLLGGMDSVPGALIGGLCVGVIQGLVSTYIDGGAVSPVVYALLLVVLLVRPQGLLGSREAVRL